MPREELIRLVTSLKLDELEWRLDTDPVDIADAYALMVKVMRLRRGEQHAKLIESRANHERFMRHLDEDVKRLVAKKLMSTIKGSLDYTVKRFMWKPVVDSGLPSYAMLEHVQDVPVVHVYCGNCYNKVTTINAVELMDEHLVELKCPVCKKPIRAEVEVKIEGLEDEIRDFLLRVLRKYPWLRYASFVPIFSKYSLIALVFDPPEVVYKRGIKCRSWVEYFIPHKRREMRVKGRTVVEVELQHRPLAARFFYSFTRLKVGLVAVNVDRVKAQLKKMNSNVRLMAWFESQLKRLYARYQNEARAIANAYRDLVRICLLNTYLVYSYLAHRAGKIQAVMLPYELAKMPANAASYFNPMDTMHKMYIKTCSNYVGVDLKEITWIWAVGTNGIKIEVGK